MARSYPVPGARGALVGRHGLMLILLALVVLAVAGGAALAFGFTTKTKPLDAAMTAERTVLASPVPVVSRVDLTNCEPLESEEATATTPSH